MENTLSKLMMNHFDNLTLRPPLFYHWKYGIRFEIAMPWVEHTEKRNLDQIKERSTGIFNKVFHNSNEMLLITDVHSAKNDSILQRRPTKVYQKFIKDKKLRAKLQHHKLPTVFLADNFGEDFKDDVTHRFILPCKKNDIRYTQLLTAIGIDLHIRSNNGTDIYFINLTKRMIYHLYDDRGCDVIASDKEDLRLLYEDLNGWILDYDRDEIDQLFK